MIRQDLRNIPRIIIRKRTTQQRIILHTLKSVVIGREDGDGVRGGVEGLESTQGRGELVVQEGGEGGEVGVLGEDFAEGGCRCRR